MKVSGQFGRFLCFFLLATRPPSGLAQTVSNGGFETPLAPLSADTNYLLFSAGGSFPGWTVDTGAVALMASESSGQREQALALDGEVYQNLSTLSGVDYMLSFTAWFGGDDVPPPLKIGWGTNTLSVRSSGTNHTYA